MLYSWCISLSTLHFLLPCTVYKIIFQSTLLKFLDFWRHCIGVVGVRGQDFHSLFPISGILKSCFTSFLEISIVCCPHLLASSVFNFFLLSPSSCLCFARHCFVCSSLVSSLTWTRTVHAASWRRTSWNLTRQSWLRLAWSKAWRIIIDSLQSFLNPLFACLVLRLLVETSSLSWSIFQR